MTKEARRWTKYEDAWLQQVWPKTEIPAEAIARSLKRTVGSIRQKAQKLGVKRSWFNSPKRKENLEKMHETYCGSPEQKEHLDSLHETYLGSPENLEVLKRMRKKSQETWIGSPEQKEHLRRARKKGQKKVKEWNHSLENVENLKLARRKSRAKPSWSEAIFYGLVYGYDGLANEFRAQERIPTTVCDHTVDGRWRDVIFELDGGGHNVYRDVTRHDCLVDAEYQTMGYLVVRKETASELFLRVLQVVEK